MSRPAVFKSWFPLAQRAWLDQHVHNYYRAIQAGTVVPFVISITERFLTEFPVRRARRLANNSMTHKERVKTIRIRIRACLLLTTILYSAEDPAGAMTPNPLPAVSGSLDQLIHYYSHIFNTRSL
ncbi:hypothetical protein H1R20_g10552, partial [Candolleomyces eurysporus]